MATILKNLSEYDTSKLPSKERLMNQRFAITVADWNADITHAMLRGAIDTLLENGVAEENIVVKHVPGTFELTYSARILQDEDRYAAIIAIGCVIKGNTPHFDYVCQGVTTGLSILNSNGTSPVIFSVLTTDTLEQALDRAGGKHGNKGVEGAFTAIKMANL
ncbi:6,7-dimethyl-8-ribityllumazine synthase [Porphyromonadaceae bacterium COT-184 OH4590]|nr:6,7-dimethyl-8-ribityllumazine synthase [Porphyromonadaceae bacterium COT-184 OH4590]